MSLVWTRTYWVWSPSRALPYSSSSPSTTRYVLQPCNALLLLFPINDKVRSPALQCLTPPLPHQRQGTFSSLALPYSSSSPSTTRYVLLFPINDKVRSPLSHQRHGMVSQLCIAVNWTSCRHCATRPQSVL